MRRPQAQSGKERAEVFPLVGAALAVFLGIAFRHSKLAASLMFGAAALSAVAWLTGHRVDRWAVAVVAIDLIAAPLAAMRVRAAFVIGKSGKPQRRRRSE